MEKKIIKRTVLKPKYRIILITLKENYKKILLAIAVTMALVFLITWAIKLDHEFMESCINQGYSKEYCELQR